MDARIGEIVQSARMIEIQMRQHDMADVRWRIAHCLDLVQRRLLRPEMDIEQRTKERSEEHTSELQSLMRISYAVFCLKKQRSRHNHNNTNQNSNNKYTTRIKSPVIR